MTIFNLRRLWPVNTRSIFWFLLVIFTLGFTGCRSYRDMSYLSNLDLTPDAPAVDSLDTPLAYRIHPGDNLFVNVLSGNHELDVLYNPSTQGTTGSNAGNNIWSAQSSQYVFGYTVSSKGVLTLPTFGDIPVSGLTLPECEQVIKSRVLQVVKEATVRVRLLNYRITVLGEVFNPGVYFNYNHSANIFDAIGMANGAKNTAALNHVLVVRKAGDHNRIIRLNLNEASILRSEGYRILPNDVVIVQPASYKNAELKLPIISIVASSVTTLLLILNFVVKNY